MRMVVIGGAGEMGSVAVEYLNQQPECREIVIADYEYKKAADLKDRLEGNKISVRECDVTNRSSLKDVISEATVVMNFAGPFYRLAHHVIEAVIDSGTNYYVDICDDYDATRKILEYDDDAKKADTTILTGMGASPGITNVYARMGANWLDQAEEIDTAWATEDMEGKAVLLHVLHSSAGRIPSYRKGAFQEIKPMDDEGALKVLFPEPLGEVIFYDIGHPEPITIPRFIDGVKTVTNKGALGSFTKTVRNIVQAELWREKPVKIGGHLISPAEFTAAFLQQNPHLISPGDSIGLGALYVSVTGRKAGETVKYEFMSVSSASMGEGTSVPAAAAAAILLGLGKIKQPGVIAPECIDPSLLLKQLAKIPVPEGQVNSGLIIRLTRENGEINVISPGRPITMPS